MEPRFYRKQMDNGRFRSFTVGYKDTDLWIGVDPKSYAPEMQATTLQEIKALRSQLEAFIAEHPLFATSFEPISVPQNSPAIVQQMAHAGQKAQTGPMAAVAGAFSEFVGRKLAQTFHLKEIVVENGGDLYLQLNQPITLSVYAGNSPLSGKVGIQIPAADTPMGVCTSAGTVGPSISFGKADAVMVVCRNTALADAYATAFGNQIQSETDIQPQLNRLEQLPEIESMLIVCNGQIGIKGKYPLKIIG
mgnify:CR=1 FL=1